MTPVSARLSRAACRARTPGAEPCADPAECPFRGGQGTCREIAAAVSGELAAILDERHSGSSQVADLLQAVSPTTPRIR